MAKDLNEAVNSSSALNRNLGLFFVSFIMYLMVTVASTTDLMLLLPDSKVHLPLLNIEIGLFTFYGICPYLVLFMHLNLLLNLNRHSEKLRAWKTKFNEQKKHLLDHSRAIKFTHFFCALNRRPDRISKSYDR